MDILVGLEDHPDMVPAGLRETKSATVHPNYTLGKLKKGKLKKIILI